MSLGPPYARALAIPSYFSRGGVPKDRGVAPRRFPHFWFYDGYKKKKKKKVPRGGRRRDRSKFNSLCQRGGWLRRANGAGRALGTGAALRPVLAGIRAMNGTLSAKRCVKLAPCSAAEAPCTGLSTSAWCYGTGFTQVNTVVPQTKYRRKDGFQPFQLPRFNGCIPTLPRTHGRRPACIVDSPKANTAVR